jgi:hypothetical protein
MDAAAEADAAAAAAAAADAGGHAGDGSGAQHRDHVKAHYDSHVREGVTTAEVRGTLCALRFGFARVLLLLTPGVCSLTPAVSRRQIPPQKHLKKALTARREGAAAPLKEFHNEVKRRLIYRFAYRAPKLLDYACGRGGDLHKWKAAQVQGWWWWWLVVVCACVLMY